MNKKEKSLQESAINVINRRFTIDDVEYFVRNVMQPSRYSYMMSSYDFTKGYNEAKESFIEIVNAHKRSNADQQITKIRSDVEEQTYRTIGDQRFSTMMDDYWAKGYAFAYQEFVQFLSEEPRKE